LLLLMASFLFASPMSARAGDIEPTGEALGKARLLVSNMKFQPLLDQTPFTVPDEIHKQLRDANPGREAGVSTFFNLEVMPILFTRDFDYLEPMAEALAERFTADELDQILAFYQTTVGQKFLQELPSMRMEMNAVSLMAQRKLRTDVLDAIAPRAQHYGLRLPTP
jgi:hypothetical protein